jgi:hypothetical protein
MGIYPHGEWGWGRNAPRKSSWGSPRGIFFVAGMGAGSQNPTGISPLPSLVTNGIRADPRNFTGVCGLGVLAYGACGPRVVTWYGI